MASRNINEEIAKELQDNLVVLYMKGNRHMPQCGFSAAAVAMLDEIGVPYKEVNVLADPEIRAGIKAYGQWATIPQLYVAGELVGGSDIMREMHAKGELTSVIQAAQRA